MRSAQQYLTNNCNAVIKTFSCPVSRFNFAAFGSATKGGTQGRKCHLTYASVVHDFFPETKTRKRHPCRAEMTGNKAKVSLMFNEACNPVLGSNNEQSGDKAMRSAPIRERWSHARVRIARHVPATHPPAQVHNISLPKQMHQQISLALQKSIHVNVEILQKETDGLGGSDFLGIIFCLERY